MISRKGFQLIPWNRVEFQHLSAVNRHFGNSVCVSGARRQWLCLRNSGILYSLFHVIQKLFKAASL